MACYHPRKGWRARSVNADTGRRPIVFNPRDGFEDMPVEVPCGSCIGCRLERSRQWAMRCHHEASLYDSNCFITLTYNMDNIPTPPSVSVRPLQLFMKKLRKKYGSSIRFFACGEYGGTSNRPHYHAILFNHDFPDKKLWKLNKQDDAIYTSETLENLWGLGFTTVAGVSFKSAAYVSRYIMKKVTGEQAESHYTWIDPETGEILPINPEFVTMSRGGRTGKGGIGQGWFNKWHGDVYPDDFLVIDGNKHRPPKYYDKLAEKAELEEVKRLKGERKRRAKIFEEHNTPERRKVREKVKTAQISSLGRDL